MLVDCVLIEFTNQQPLVKIDSLVVRCIEFNHQFQNGVSPNVRSACSSLQTRNNLLIKRQMPLVLIAPAGGTKRLNLSELTLTNLVELRALAEVYGYSACSNSMTYRCMDQSNES
jgi:hypothetical protein